MDENHRELASIHALLTHHIQNAQARDSRDDEFRGWVKKSMGDMAGQITTLTKRVDETERGLEETRQLARNALDSATDLESETLVAIGGLERKTDEQNVVLSQLQTDTRSLLDERIRSDAQIKVVKTLVTWLVPSSAAVAGVIIWALQHFAAPPQPTTDEMVDKMVRRLQATATSPVGSR